MELNIGYPFNCIPFNCIYDVEKQKELDCVNEFIDDIKQCIEDYQENVCHEQLPILKTY